MHDVCIVCTAVGEKAHFGTKNSKEIKPIAISIVELCLGHFLGLGCA